MPFKSKAQIRWMAQAEKKGEVKKGTFDLWKAHTHAMKTLSNKVKKHKK